MSVHDLADLMCRIENITPHTTLPPNYLPPLPTTRLQRLQKRAINSAIAVTKLHRTLPVQLFVERWSNRVGSVGRVVGVDKYYDKLYNRLPGTSEVEEEVDEEVRGAGSYIRNLFGRGSGTSGTSGNGSSVSGITRGIGGDRRDSNIGTDTSDSTSGSSGGTGGVWTGIKSSVGGVATTLKNRWGAERQSKEVVGIIPPKKEIGECITTCMYVCGLCVYV